MLILAKKSIIQWNRDSEDDPIIMERVLWIDEVTDTIVLYRLTDDKEDHSLPQQRSLSEIHEALSMQLAVFRPVDPYERKKINYKDIRIKKHIEQRDKTWEQIGKYLTDEPDIYNEKLRGAMINEIIDKKVEDLKTKRSIYRVFRKYWKYGKSKDSIINLFENMGGPGQPRVITEFMLQQAKDEGRKIPKRGRPRFILETDPTQEGINIDEKTERLMIGFQKREFLTLKKPPLNEVYVDFLAEYYSVGSELNKDGVSVPLFDPEGRFPSWDQFKNVFYKNRDLRNELKKRVGTKRFNLDHRAVLGSTTENDQLFAGSVYQVDSTIASVHLVNRFDRRRNIGKATVYLVMDVLSRKIVGFYVSVTDPSWKAVQMALFDAFTNAIADGNDELLLEKTCYLPDRIVWDRAQEQLSIASDHLANTLDTILTSTASYRADWKAIVEQAFNNLRKKIIDIPGAVKKGYRERGERDYREDAILDIGDFSKQIEDIIEHHNSHFKESYPLNEKMLIDNIYPFPKDIWDWGIQNGGALRQYSAQKVMFHLMPQKQATVTKHGIKIGKRHYICPYADHNRWFEKANKSGNWKIEVAYDQRKPNVIYLLLDDGRVELCELKEIDKFYQNYHEAEIDDIGKREKIKADSKKAKQYESDAALKASKKAIIEAAKKKTEMDRLTQGKVIDITESRADERIRTHEEEAEQISLVLQNKSSENDFHFPIDDIEDDEEIIPASKQKESMLKKLINR